MAEIKDLLVGFGLAVLVFALGYFLFVHKCNYIAVNRADETRCHCLGKVVNIKLLLGSEDALTLPKYEQCVGIVKGRY